MSRLFLTLFAVAGFLPCFANAALVIADTEMSLSGIAIGQSKESVVKALGKPSSSRKLHDFLDLEFNYPTLTVFFAEEQVGELFTTNPAVCTPANVCPLTSLSDARKIYGKPIYTKRSNGNFYEYPASNACWLQLAVSRNIIRSIRVACQP